MELASQPHQPWQTVLHAIAQGLVGERLRRERSRAIEPASLLLDAMQGDSDRFTRQDGVEETWRIMQPLLDAPPPAHPYAPGSWGPEAAERLVQGLGSWHTPWVAR